jgi:hypothetical protein
MSVRDDPTLFLQQGKGSSSGGSAISGGNAITTTRVHKLDGPEHSAADDTTTLDASTTRHGLMAKLSGDADDVWHGDGTWAHGTAGITVQDEGTPLATAGTTLNFVGAGVAAAGTGATKTVTVSEPDADAHIADTSDAHDASAISIVDAGGYTPGSSDVEAALQQLGAIVVGIDPHGSLGSTETFSATKGTHTGTLNLNCTFTLSGFVSGLSEVIALWLTQDASGGKTITLPAAVSNKTALEAAQDTTALSTSILVLWSLDGGTTIVGGWWGGSGGSSLTIKDEGSSLATAATSIDFVGAGVVASGTGAAKTVTISGAPAGAAGGDLSGTYPNPSVVDDSHNHTAATLPASGGASEHAHVVSEAHLSTGSSVTHTLDQAFEPGSVIAWNTTTLARLTVTETQPDRALVAPAGSAGDVITYDYAATLA